MKKVLQRTIQVLSLALFVFLLISGKIQVWMVIFVASVLLALLFSRFYCGWLCPINTILRPMTYLKRKLKIKSLKTPAFFKNGVFRIIMLLAFLAVMVVVFRTGKKLPVLPALFLIGVLLSLFFEEELWHHWLCPYGTILSLPGRVAKKSMVIDPSLCTNCTRCAKVCPSGAIVREEKHRIIKSECLVCHECERVCSKGAISYK
ncbi:MAG: 4Fe-4S binding protein [Sphaerochaeta associata]|uniref:4Fe-4S binding protein n=1 Tax=Sphaerochaeta associata TaxID=1129264 RepID=UPI002B210190|nr:4Fe-4S binding protein [Sphaerochaeta associata]MEA5028723.1 4Fe-4S binding protein [Sphaerochaeta associata]